MPPPPKSRKPPREVLALLALKGARTVELASKPIEWVWAPSIAAGSTVTIGGPPTCGKSSLLFRFLVARANLPTAPPLEILERPVVQAPEGRLVVVIEEEPERRIARKLVRAVHDFPGIDPAPIYDRIWTLAAEHPVTVGDTIWGEVERLVAAGEASDVVIDTLANTTKEEANNEQAQIELYRKFKRLLAAYPKDHPLPPPVLWIVGHTRKGDDDACRAEDLAGSQQRIGQTDTLLMLQVERDLEGIQTAAVCHFRKERDNVEGDPSRPIRFDRYGKVKAKPSKATAQISEAKLLEALQKPGEHTVNSLVPILHSNPKAVRFFLEALEVRGVVKREAKKVKGNLCETFHLVSQ